MPDHYSPRPVAQQVFAKLLRGFCAPPSESRNRAVHQPEYCGRSGHACARSPQEMWPRFLEWEIHCGNLLVGALGQLAK
jgi:hypothetical protein